MENINISSERSPVFLVGVLISALLYSALFAKWVVVSNTQINNDLSNLSMQKILLCIVIYALMSSGFHQYWFVLRDLESGSINHFLVMFAGDVIGSILLIALIKYGIDLMRRGAPRAS